MSGAARTRPSRVTLSSSAAPMAPSTPTVANCSAENVIGRECRAAAPVMTTCAAQNRAEAATSASPGENESSVAPPSSHVRRTPRGRRPARRPQRACGGKAPQVISGVITT